MSHTLGALSDEQELDRWHESFNTGKLAHALQADSELQGGGWKQPPVRSSENNAMHRVAENGDR